MGSVKDEIEKRFDRNLARVRALVSAYEAARPGVPGRPDVTTTDILRSSVVFLHASLEDLLRSTLLWKLPTASPENLKDVPLLGHEPRSKYTMEDLARHRGLSVDEVVARSVAATLERSNFNDEADVASVLGKCGISTADRKKLLDTYAPDLTAMMGRRHWIVHRADQNQAQGIGHFAARSLHPDTVRTWLKAVEAFGKAVLALL